MNLPEPGGLEKMESVRFGVEATLVHRLGHESVSDPVLALLELVKNGYDADATNVSIKLRNLRTGNASIVISDDGSGMSLAQLKGAWMRVATSAKSQERTSKKYKRTMLGEKGIGRFAVENLSTLTTLVSYPENEKTGYIIKFDWSRFKPGDDLFGVENEMSKFEKAPEVHGLEIRLRSLRSRWAEADIQRLLQFIRSMTPPTEVNPDFKVEIDTDEFKDLTGIVGVDFLEKAVFTFGAELAKNGDISYELIQHGKGRVRDKSGKMGDFTCGPVKFKMHFYYREKSKLKQYGIDVDDIKHVRKLLNDYGGIKVYRDGMRLSGFGNPGDDWTGLDALSRNDPTIVPARDQIIASVIITSLENPEINDTTTRENLIKNQSFLDLLKFVNDAIGVFAQMRAEVENKRKPAPPPPPRYIEAVREQLQKNKEREALLDFSDQYPLYFYLKLEEEINKCWAAGLPNATLILSRKLVENLLYNILEEKFPDKINLRYDINQGRAKDFSVLVESLEAGMGEFNREQKDLIAPFLAAVKPFRREANSAAHKVIDYLENLDELTKLKIPEIIQYELYLIQKLKAEKKSSKE